MSLLNQLEPYLIPASIAGVGTLLWSSFQSFARGINKRLDALEVALSSAVKDITAIVVRQQVDQIEIANLRQRQHKIETDVVALDAVQARCRVCSPRS